MAGIEHGSIKGWERIAPYLIIVHSAWVLHSKSIATPTSLFARPFRKKTIVNRELKATR
jgi:hypothetical protein